jgi:hypothetical protein
MKCLNCKKANPNNFKFCGYCGADIETGQIIDLTFIDKREKNDSERPAVINRPKIETASDTAAQTSVSSAYNGSGNGSSGRGSDTGSGSGYAAGNSVPNVVGKSKDEAKSVFENLNYKIKFIGINNSEVPVGSVISQEIFGESEIVIKISFGDWSEWTPDVLTEDSDYETQSITIYRTRKRELLVDIKETKENTPMPGYELINAEAKYSEWENDKYYVPNPKVESDTCELIAKETGFKYFGYGYKDETISETYPNADMAADLNPGTTQDDWIYMEKINPVDSMSLYIDGKTFSSKMGAADTLWLRYKTRQSFGTIYTFKSESLTDWSDWTEWNKEEPGSENEYMQVQSQILYRKRAKAGE